MNEKLKQSLDTRLGGMRWGEREQAEVFRLAQRKELQDVKHVKRGTGMLAIAIALLFIVMGAAFALTNSNDQPAASNIAGQTTQPTFAPVVSHQYENDYFTLDVNTTTCTDTEAAFTATLRMKDPASYMVSLAGHTPPGDVNRTIIPVSLTAGISTTLPGDVPMASGSLRDVDVTDMTADTAVFRMSGSVASLNGNVAFTLFITWFDPTTGTEREDTITWSADAPAQPGMLLAEYDLVTVTLEDYTATSTDDGMTGLLAIDVTPSKPWYVLNRQEEGKSTLTVSAETLLLYPTFDPQDMLGMVDAREPAAAGFPVNLEGTPDGLRLTAEGILPANEEVLYGYLVLHVYSDAAEAHYDEGFDDHYYEVCIPIVTTPTEAATVTASLTPTPTPVEFTAIPATSTPTPMPALTPAPIPVLPTPVPVTRSEPTGEHISGTDTVSVYLEDSWYDGFSAEVTLRIRADDPANRLAVTPNLEAQPNENTWVVQVEIPSNTYFHDSTVLTLTLDEATGDVMVHLACQDPLPGMWSSITIPISLRVVNEKTWQTETEELSISLSVPEEYPWYPLHLVESDAADTFIQAGYIVTDRYTYVGVMQTYCGEYPAVRLTDAEGNVLAAVGSSPAINTAIERSLFPAPYTEASQATASILRLEGTEPLPETLRMEYATQYEAYMMYYVLSTEEPEDEPKQSESMGTLLSVNDVVSVYLVDSWFDGFSATATLRIRTNDPRLRLAIEPNLGTAPNELTYVAQLTGSYENHYVQDIVHTLTLDAATGDAIILLTYMESHLSSRDVRNMLNLPVTLTLTNEKTWQSIATELDINIKPSGYYPRHSLYLTGGEHTDAFLQSRYIITDRYTYIGVMHTDNGYTGVVELTDAEGNVLATTEMTGSYSPITNMFFDRPANTNSVGLSYLRIDGTQSLPEELHVRYPTEAADPIYEQYPSMRPGEQPHFVLSPTKPAKTR